MVEVIISLFMIVVILIIILVYILKTSNIHCGFALKTGKQNPFLVCLNITLRLLNKSLT